MNPVLLNTMGILSWIPRASLGSHSALISEVPLLGAACLVILPEAPPIKDSETAKIFRSMLKILMLSAEELCIAWINRENTKAISQTVRHWAPHSVLLMGEGSRYLQSGLEGSCWVQSTYHPNEIMLCKAYRQQAYQELLDLKEQIALMRTI